MDKKQLNIVLADDHKIVRQGVRLLLESEPDFHIVGEAANGADATRLVEQLKPDVLVVDLKMPGLSGIDVAKRVAASSPNTRVIILSMYSSEAYVLAALEAGAKGYVLKESSSNELVQAIRHAISGRRYLSPPLSEQSIKTYQKKTSANHQDTLAR
ncbi:MAG: response regulator transcription factor [Chloroflexota bacterium]|nr:response regulator transcription factor [Chloroflexota bacterium]